MRTTPLPVDLRVLIRQSGRADGRCRTPAQAGRVLGGTFTVLAIAGNSDQARQLGLTVAFAVFLDTFFVRTLLVPSIAVLVGRWNWWPSTLSRSAANRLAVPQHIPAGEHDARSEPAGAGR